MLSLTCKDASVNSWGVSVKPHDVWLCSQFGSRKSVVKGMAALCVEDQIRVGFNAQYVKRKERKRKRSDLQEDKERLLESGPGIEIQKAKVIVQEEEREMLESWRFTWELSQLLAKPPPVMAVGAEELDALFQ
eukprot:5441665-Amphidinium_carterae.1